MDREEVIRMAKEVGAFLNDESNAPPYYALYPSKLERFAALVAAAERERCAKFAEKYGDDAEDYQPNKGYFETCYGLADAIRDLP